VGKKLTFRVTAVKADQFEVTFSALKLAESQASRRRNMSMARPDELDRIPVDALTICHLQDRGWIWRECDT
jgi:hypothetical protein